MLVALGKNDIKTLEDLAYCAVDDLVGWTERKDGEVQRYEGALSGFELSRQDAEAIVMAARVKAGLISEADLAKPEEAAAEPAEAV
jgi:N utilization substance protein A